MEQAIGIFMLVLLVVGCIWGAHFGNGLGKDIARYQMSKREEIWELERRLKDLERKAK